MPNAASAVFRALHHDRSPDDPLILPGPWDAGSARVFEQAGFPALATPSAGVAASLGYEDGSTPPTEMFAAVTRIVRSVSVPVSVDLEAGYRIPPKELVARIVATGAVGCNLEDSEQHVLKEAHWHADWLAEVCTEAGDELFVNARVDTFTYGGGDLADAVARARLYIAAGADCVFPIGAPADAIPALRAGIEGPINVNPRPGGPGPRELGRLGGTRITFGPMLQHRAMEAVKDIAEQVKG